MIKTIPHNLQIAVMYLRKQLFVDLFWPSSALLADRSSDFCPSETAVVLSDDDVDEEFPMLLMRDTIPSEIDWAIDTVNYLKWKKIYAP